MKLKNTPFLFVYLFLIFLMLALSVRGDENRWVAIGMLHNWYSSGSCEVEVGRRHLIADQQDGLRWPAQFQNQDCQAAKALWIGVKNYNDALAQKTYNYKVVHVGPRVLDEQNEFMPVTFKLIGRTEHPLVTVDGTPACNTAFEDMLDEVDPNLKADRMLLNVVNTAIGVTITRKIYAFSQQYHNNYFIYDYVFTNTGIVDKKGTVNAQTLTDVVFFFQYRYAPSRESGPYGLSTWSPQSACWGVNTMNDVIGQNANPNDPFRSTISWLGKHAGWGGPGDIIGAPKFTTDGHLSAQQYVGILTIHADKSATENSDDPYQPTTTWYLNSDAPMTSGNDQFNADKMAQEYDQMTKGHPPVTQADAVGNEFADKWAASNGTNGGFSQTIGYGPYTLAPGESIHLVQAEAVAGLDRQSCYTIGATWLAGGTGPFTLPNGTTTTDANEYKNAWVYTGRDSLLKTYGRALATYNSNFGIPQPPPAPKIFDVASGGDRIILSWSNDAESWPGFAGYRLYRTLHTPDTTFTSIFACGAGTENPQIVNKFEDVTAVRGFDYYYYLVSFDDGSKNTGQLNPKGVLTSSIFFTRTNTPANLKRQAGTKLEQIRVVPNPYNIKARDLQYGYSAPDRIMFLDIPPLCTIKIFTERGDLIETIEHVNGSGDEAWNSITSSRQVVVSGVYIAYFEVTQDAYDPNTNELLFKKGDNIFRKFVIIR